MLQLQMGFWFQPIMEKHFLLTFQIFPVNHLPCQLF